MKNHYDAYIDEGEIPDKGILCIATYLGASDKWAILEPSWQAILERYSISHVHMKDILKYDHKQYKHLSMSERREMLYELGDLISETAKVGYLTSLLTKEFDHFADSKFKSRHGSAYSFAIAISISHILRVLSKEDPGAVVNIFIEKGHRNEVEVVQVLHDTKERLKSQLVEFPSDTLVLGDAAFSSVHAQIGEIAVGTKTGKDSRIPLQAADILAYGFIRRMKPDISDTDIALQALTRIEERIKHWHHFIRGEELATLLSVAVQQGEADAQHRHEAHKLKKFIREMGGTVREQGDFISFEFPDIEED